MLSERVSGDICAEGKTQPKGKTQHSTMLHQVKVQHKENLRLFEAQHCDLSRTFGIQHYAGRVVYDTTDFLGGRLINIIMAHIIWGMGQLRRGMGMCRKGVIGLRIHAPEIASASVPRCGRQC